MRLCLLAIVTALGACASSNSVSTVNAEVYSDLETCWERAGEFKSFVVLHEEEGKYYPYFVSPWCDVESEDYPQGLGFISYIRALKFSGDEGTLRLASLFTNDLEATTPTHSPLPVKTDPLYIYVGSVTRLENSGFLFYRLSDPKMFYRTGFTLEDLIEQSPEARLQLFKHQSK